MIIRLLNKGEEALLFSVYYSAVHGTASKDYTSEQIEAWAPKDFDMSEWQMNMQELKPFVVELDGEIIAYADLQAKGYIDHFFVSAAYARKGVGSVLMTHLHKAQYAVGHSMGLLWDKWGLRFDIKLSMN